MLLLRTPQKKRAAVRPVFYSSISILAARENSKAVQSSNSLFQYHVHGVADVFAADRGAEGGILGGIIFPPVFSLFIAEVFSGCCGSIFLHFISGLAVTNSSHTL